jgi:hypothetical protein
MDQSKEISCTQRTSERLCKTSEVFIHAAMTPPMVRRLARA